MRFAVGSITDQQRVSVTFDVEMFVDMSTAKAMDGHAPDWRPDDGWRAHGLDPSLFSQGAIPMKYPDKNHKHALEWFARAHRAKQVGGGPAFLFVLRMALAAAMRSILEGTIEVIPDRKTLQFNRVLTHENYPGLLEIRGFDYTSQMAEALAVGQGHAGIRVE